MLNFIASNYIISARIIAIRKKRQPIYLISQNKQIQPWYQYLTYVNNAQVVGAFKLVNGIDISLKKYNLVKIFLNSNDFKAYFNENKSLTNNAPQSMLLKPIFLFIETIISNIDFAFQTKKNNNNGITKLYILCIDSKST